MKTVFSKFNISIKKTSQGLALAVILIGVMMRLTIYGDLRLSVGNSDTPSYIESSNVNLLSWSAFTRHRPFTANLVYKVFTPANGYRVGTLAGYETGTLKRKIVPGFKDIALLQTILSILAWTCLAWTFTSRLQNAMVKVISAGMIMMFGFSPQPADWDSIITSESLSLSLFILAFAILIWLAFAYYDQPTSSIKKTIGLIVFFAALFLWVFVRDVNVFSLIILAPLLLGIYWIPRFRKTKIFLLAGLVVISLFIVGEISARQRPLWQLALQHVWNGEIFPVPAYVEYFSERGMPKYDTSAYSEWFGKRAPAAYMQFLLVHPGFTTRVFFRDMNIAFSDTLQPYFNAKNLPTRPLLIMIGEYLHPRSAAIFFIVITLLLTLLSHALFQNNPGAFLWIWLMSWAFLSASVTLFFTIFGDSYGLARHALSSTTTYRLLMWMLLMLLADFSLTRVDKQTSPT